MSVLDQIIVNSYCWYRYLTLNKVLDQKSSIHTALAQTSSQELWPKPGYDLNCNWLLNELTSCDVMLPKLKATNISSSPWPWNIGVAWFDFTTCAHIHMQILTYWVEPMQYCTSTHPRSSKWFFWLHNFKQSYRGFCMWYYHWQKCTWHTGWGQVSLRQKS